MVDSTPILSIVIGLCWTDFLAVWSPGAGSSRSLLIRMTLASSLILTSLAALFSEPKSALSLILLSAIAAAVILAARRVNPAVALTAASVGFAFYLSGAAP